MSRSLLTRQEVGIAEWAVALYGVVLVLMGLPILAAGLWAMALGGPWLYLVAGAGLVSSGVLVLRGSVSGLWILFFTYAVLLAWAFSAPGMTAPALLSLLMAPTLMAALGLLVFPVMGRVTGTGRRRRFGGRYGVPAGLGMALSAALVTLGLMVSAPSNPEAASDPLGTTAPDPQLAALPATD